MFRNCYEGISPNEHLKKTENPTVSLHDEENKTSDVGSFRSHWDPLFKKSPCSFIESVSFTVTVSCTVKGQSEYRLFF